MKTLTIFFLLLCATVFAQGGSVVVEKPIERKPVSGLVDVGTLEKQGDIDAATNLNAALDTISARFVDKDQSVDISGVAAELQGVKNATTGTVRIAAQKALISLNSNLGNQAEVVRQIDLYKHDFGRAIPAFERASLETVKSIAYSKYNPAPNYDGVLNGVCDAIDIHPSVTAKISNLTANLDRCFFAVEKATPAVRARYIASLKKLRDYPGFPLEGKKIVSDQIYTLTARYPEPVVQPAVVSDLQARLNAVEKDKADLQKAVIKLSNELGAIKRGQ